MDLTDKVAVANNKGNVANVAKGIPYSRTGARNVHKLELERCL